MYYINNFFIFSIIGFIFETILNLILNHKLNSGFLYGPYTPIYGIGIIVIIIINKYLDTKNLKPIIKLVLTLIINTLILTITELIGGYLIKWFFHKSLWNYSKLPLHIGKYISVEVSITWGILSLIFIYFVKNKTDKIINKIPNYLSYIFIITIICDLIITLLTKIK